MLTRTPYVIQTNDLKQVLRKESIDRSVTSRAVSVSEVDKVDEPLINPLLVPTTKTNIYEMGADGETKITGLLLSEMPILNQPEEHSSPFKWDSSNTSSEHPSPSPIFNENLFLSERLEDMPTGSEYLHGISNINYDFNIFLDTAERSVSDESIDKKFKSDDQIVSSTNQAAINVDEFDPLKNAPGTPTKDSIIDRPVPPVQTNVMEYMGFSHFEIPTISCSTGGVNFTPEQLEQGTSSGVLGQDWSKQKTHQNQDK